MRYPGKVKRSVRCPCAPARFSCQVHVGFVCVSRLGSYSSAPKGPVCRRGAGGGRGRAFSRPQKLLGRQKPWDLRTVPPFCLSFWVSGAPSSLRLCSWQPSRAGAGALAAARNPPGHFCARGGLWQADSHAKWAWQKGGSGLRAALETSAPPRSRLRVAGNKVSGRAGRLGRDSGDSAPGPLRGGGSGAGLTAWGQFQV